MHLQTETERMLARALHCAGQTDRQIADACQTSVNNIIWWRKEESLTENVSDEAKARAEEDRYTPLVRRDAPRAGSAAASAAQPPGVAEPRLITPQEAQAAFFAAVQPVGDNALEIGARMGSSEKVFVDLEELLTTRLLIQGNSGSGKSHLLRRILEECAGIVQQIIIDPEGDFVTFGEAFGHTVADANEHSPAKLKSIGAKARQLRGSVVLTLEGMEIEQQMDAVSAFLDGLFNAPSDHWHPVLVAVDEAHLFAPSMDNGEDKESRKTSQQAMANLMCRGRKRGLAGLLATQRLSKLHKNVAAEASNFLLGRTFLDIDIKRAADLLGMSNADSEQVRGLNRGEFLGLGPAIARRALKVKVGSVMTLGRAGLEKGITPLPALKPEDMQNALLADDENQDEQVVVPFARVAK